MARPFSHGLVRRFGRRDRDEDMGLAYPRAANGEGRRAVRRGKTRQDEARRELNAEAQRRKGAGREGLVIPWRFRARCPKVLHPPTAAPPERARELPAWEAPGALQTLEVYRLENARYSLMDTFEGGEPVRAEPFDSLPLELDALWRL